MNLQDRLLQLPCSEQIDYSTVVGPRIIPFVFELDLINSILSPSPGQNQRFCYTITGVGQDSPIYANLSHFLLGICPQIPAEQIVNITVVIDGVPQTVVFGPGGNVELRTPDNPDPPTGCPGLKFNFGLNKVGGVMNVCFELTQTYSVCPNGVCVSGGGVTAKGLSICGPCCAEPPQTCSTIAYQTATVCVPVSVKPFAIAGPTVTRCCGNPIITPGSSICGGTVNGSCVFTLTQNICVAVPIEFGANTTVGSPRVACGETSSDDICMGCTG